MGPRAVHQYGSGLRAGGDPLNTESPHLQRLAVRAVRLLWRVGLLGAAPLLAREQFFDQGALLQHPWFTGPLLAPASNALPAGLGALQFDLYQLNRYGRYQDDWSFVRLPTYHSLMLALPMAYGIFPNVDVQVIPRIFYNTCQGATSTQLGDFIAGFDWQIHDGAISSWVPSVKFAFREIFPNGRFDRLDPEHFGTEIGGTGSYCSVAGVTFRKLVKFDEVHYLSNILNLRISYSAPTNVRGLSLYGGSLDTCGRIFPGLIYEGILSWEYSITDNWAVAFDIDYLYQARDRFRGNPGTNPEGLPAVVGDPPSSLLSFCPAIEYNVDFGLGIIAGVWFSAAGRNAPAFATFACEIVYVF